jgi:hypothetical protein
MKENIEANEGILSKTLATILLDCPLFWRKGLWIIYSDVEKQMLF